MHNYDVVFIHGLWQFHSYAVYKALKKYKKSGSGNLPKMYVMPHGMLDPYFQKAAGRKLKAIRNWLYWKLVEGKVVNAADGVLFTCQQELELARTTFSPYKPKKELNVSFGIMAPPNFKPEMSEAFALSCPDVIGKNYLLFLSRVHEKKGVDLLISAYLKIKKEYSNVPNLVIAGPGLDTAYGKRMLELAYDNASIHFPGMVTGDSKWGAFYGCEAFILPSHQENFGIAVVEALACYKPVLISNQINIWNEIADAQAGIIENDTDEGAYNLLLKWIKTGEHEKAELCKNARNAYIDKFKSDAAALQLYNALNQK
jgi:glycosyltransferase involved in cell wall biosynthesis